MKTIQQQSTITFAAATFRDALTMLDLMDYLQRQAINAETYNAYYALDKEQQALYKWPHHPEMDKAKEKFELLLSLGFLPTNEVEIVPQLELKEKK